MAPRDAPTRRRICRAVPRSASTCCSPTPTAVPLPEQRGVEGHLRVRGAAVIERYFGDEQPATDADGWFPTGDLARIDADGNLIITGRAKDLIKSGGEWINPAEIEARGQRAARSVAGRGDRPAARKWGERPVLVVETRASHGRSATRRCSRRCAARWRRGGFPTRSSACRACRCRRRVRSTRSRLRTGIWRRSALSRHAAAKRRRQRHVAAAPTKVEQRADTMEQILDAAEYLFSKHGLHGVTLKDVAQARRRAPHAAQLLLRRQEEAVRRRVRAPRGGHEHAADGGARRVRRGDQGQAHGRGRAARVPRHRPRSLHPGRRGLEELRRARRAGRQHARMGRRADGSSTSIRSCCG